MISLDLKSNIKYTSFSCISYQLILLKVNKKYHVHSFKCQLPVYNSSSFPHFFFSFPLLRENYCPDVKCGIILIAPFSGSRLMPAPWRAKLGFSFHPASLLISLCGDEEPQPFGLGAQVTCPVQQVLVWGQNPPSHESKGQSEFSAAFQWCLLTLSAFTLSIKVFAWGLCGRSSVRIPGTPCGNFWGLLSLINHRIYMLNYLWK